MSKFLEKLLRSLLILLVLPFAVVGAALITFFATLKAVAKYWED